MRPGARPQERSVTDDVIRPVTWTGNAIRLIDKTLLPGPFVYGDVDDVFEFDDPGSVQPLQSRDSFDGADIASRVNATTA